MENKFPLLLKRPDIFQEKRESNKEKSIPHRKFLKKNSFFKNEMTLYYNFINEKK
jgi:hypothetical protein